ncbi:DUF1990 family protein [Sporichthya sp.]|uniref:DUF1990 family protein n=1 Tax=Sporichthya sp. TaxID=65475 RepID=UPI0025FD16D5|nr:DUF1990 domain-containing protein [Sporichthya sp.]
MRLTRGPKSLLAQYEGAAFTYPEVGATAGTLPAGYHHLIRRTRIGDGSATFEQASSALSAWRMQSGSGLRVATNGPAEVGRTVVLALGRPIGLAIPCRVVWTVDEPRRRGFGYGTLPGHPESGEESFILTLDDDDAIWLTVTAFTRPGDVVVRLFGPVARGIQSHFIDRYGRALIREANRQT